VFRTNQEEELKMTSGAATTKTHVFLVHTGSPANDQTINSFAGSQAVQLITGKARLLSLKVSNNQTTAMDVRFYDGAGGTTGSAFNGKLIHKVHIGAVRENLDFDMHGAIVSDGLYVLVSGAGTKVNVSVSAQYN